MMPTNKLTITNIRYTCPDKRFNNLQIIILFFTALFSLAFATPGLAKQAQDIDITLAIENELWGDEAIDANLIDINTQQGVVTLTGTASHILAKERAEKIAETTVGVRAVVNRITVKPGVNRSDEELKKFVESALFLDPATDSYEVTVKAENGVVTLTGTVDSWQERQLSAIVAKGVSGVTDVKNDITVNYKTDRSDLEIEKEVKARLENDVLVDDYLVEVKVKNGKVILSGTVGSLAEKNRAYADAYVGGVSSVDSAALKIEPWARDKMRRKNAYETRSDDQIKKAVKDALFYDPRVTSFNPEVSVNNGTVTLRGVVDNLCQKSGRTGCPKRHWCMASEKSS
jgi:osmotically-inducible protein OsmY